MIQLLEGTSLSDESLAQEGLTYEKDTRTVHVNWSKFTALEQKKRVSMSFIVLKKMCVYRLKPSVMVKFITHKL
ncbi:hypothetical protein CHH62_22040 [Niallia circulans]|nr:hypothetical protein CHH62_22040 [Niallia circulans]